MLHKIIHMALPKKAIQKIGDLPTEDLLEMQAHIAKVIEKRQRSGEPVEPEKTPTVSYREQYIKCGKEKCKCAQGHLHGPYKYAYWREGGKVITKYVGKK